MAEFREWANGSVVQMNDDNRVDISIIEVYASIEIRDGMWQFVDLTNKTIIVNATPVNKTKDFEFTKNTLLDCSEQKIV